MSNDKPHVLVLNGGSSSIKFAVYRMDDPPQRQLDGKVDRIGLRGSHFTYRAADRDGPESRDIGDLDHPAAAAFLVDWIDGKFKLASLAAAGHRVVTGGARYSEAQRVTREMMDELRRMSAYAPEHLPAELALIDLLQQRCASLTQVACFDTAFHRDLPRVARILPIPRRFQAQGVVRYGFHGLSYSFLMDELARIRGDEASRGRVILAHLGNGASLAAVRDGKCIDTSMGFTPAAGVPMGKRSGDLDPGLVWYLAQTEHMTAEQFHHMVNHESGLLGVSETSSDLRDLLAREAEDVRAAEAVGLFCYQVRKFVGAFAAALGGLDTLVFAGGIGENAPEVRSRICAELEFLGVQLDPANNAANAPVISVAGCRVDVRVIRTDEEMMIAKALGRLLGETNIRHPNSKEIGA